MADTISLFEDKPKDRKMFMNPEATADWYKRTNHGSVVGTVSRKTFPEVCQEELADATFVSLTAVIGREVPTVIGAEEDSSIGRLIDHYLFPRKEGPTMLMRRQFMNEIVAGHEPRTFRLATLEISPNVLVSCISGNRQ